MIRWQIPAFRIFCLNFEVPKFKIIQFYGGSYFNAQTK
jgi:hypothetical protein